MTQPDFSCDFSLFYVVRFLKHKALTEQIIPSALRLLLSTHLDSVGMAFPKTASNVYFFLRLTKTITPDNIAASGINETAMPVAGLSLLFGLLLSLGT